MKIINRKLCINHVPMLTGHNRMRQRLLLEFIIAWLAIYNPAWIWNKRWESYLCRNCLKQTPGSGLSCRLHRKISNHSELTNSQWASELRASIFRSYCTKLPLVDRLHDFAGNILRPRICHLNEFKMYVSNLPAHLTNTPSKNPIKVSLLLITLNHRGIPQRRGLMGCIASSFGALRTNQVDHWSNQRIVLK